MLKILVMCRAVLAGMMVGGLAFAAQAQSSPAAGPLVVIAVPDATPVYPGDALKFNVEIKNVSKEEQHIDVPNIVWAAQTDTPLVTIPGWPARGGVGPVVVYKSVVIAAGESYQHTWTANVSASAPAGELSLKVGVPLTRGAEQTWSEPVKLTVVVKEEAKESVANPLYDAWKGQEKKQVTYARTEEINGGVQMAGGGANPPTSTELIESVGAVTADRASVIWDYRDNTNGELQVILAKMRSDDPALPKLAGTEDLKIGDKTYACKKYTYTTDSKAEMGCDGQGLRGQVTVWAAEGVPGGVVKRTVLLTIRVSYEVTDIISEK